MARRKKPKTITGMILQMCIAPLSWIIDYAFHYKPTPLVGKKKGRKKKKLF